MKTILLFAAISSATVLLPGSPACIAVDSDKISAGSVARFIPELQILDPAVTLGFAPMPGSKRIFSSHELIAVAQQHGLTLDAGKFIPEVCVERFARTVTKEEMKTALVHALGLPAAELQLLDFSQQLFPSGRLDFQLGGLNRPRFDLPNTPVIWRGRLIYDGQRSLNIWAKVVITMEATLLTASETIPAGSIIHQSQINECLWRRFPFSPPVILSPGAIVGKVAQRVILNGQPFALRDLEEPKDVAKGDKVRVRGIDGLAVVSFDGIAESSGYKGDTILVRNPSSGKNFRAVIDEKGKAVVRPGPAS